MGTLFYERGFLILLCICISIYPHQISIEVAFFIRLFVTFLGFGLFRDLSFHLFHPYLCLCLFFFQISSQFNHDPSSSSSCIWDSPDDPAPGFNLQRIYFYNLKFLHIRGYDQKNKIFLIEAYLSSSFFSIGYPLLIHILLYLFVHCLVLSLFMWIGANYKLIFFVRALEVLLFFSFHFPDILCRCENYLCLLLNFRILLELWKNQIKVCEEISCLLGFYNLLDIGLDLWYFVWSSGQFLHVDLLDENLQDPHSQNINFLIPPVPVPCAHTFAFIFLSNWLI